VPRAYEEMGEKIKIKKLKIGSVIQNKIQDVKNTIFFQTIKFHYKPTCEVGSGKHIS
jgi:hypothetical protein